MDITCPQCRTEYEFDDDKVTPAGVTVKCTNCNYMFKVRTREVVETEPVSQGVSPEADGDPETEETPWMIRNATGQILQFMELTTLQQWIVERRVTREDEISRRGNTWKRLGDISELGSFFEVVDAAMGVRGGYAAPDDEAPAGPNETSMGDEGAFANGVEEPAFANAENQFRDVGHSAAWEQGGASLPGADVVEDEIPRTATGKVIGVLVLVVLLVGGGVGAFLARDRLSGLFSGQSERSNEAYQAGRKLFLRDDTKSLTLADRQFALAPKDHGLALAARAEVLTVWTQHLRDESQLLERKASRIESTLAKRRNKPGPRARGARGKKRHRRGKDHRRQAPPTAAPVEPQDDPKLIRLFGFSCFHFLDSYLNGGDRTILVQSTRDARSGASFRYGTGIGGFRGQNDLPIE